MAAQTVAAAPKAIFHPPASQFAELLRRSKFASYDPAIRQTYQASPGNAHRGDWGVKRPISLRRRNAFISLTSFEHHAHFTEWNHAENQVRFIRRIEEMGGRAEMYKTTPWYKSLGIARSEPPIDSDICPGEVDELLITMVKNEVQEPSAEPQTRLPLSTRLTTNGKPKAESTAQSTVQNTKEVETVNLHSLGRRGSGAYGTQREDPPRDVYKKDIFTAHNIHAMSKREFKRYLRSLRTQRSEFQKFINEEEKIKEKDLFVLAEQEDDIYYRRFLQSQLRKEYMDYGSKKLEPQPHPNGALLYTAPTSLERVFWTQAKPGFYLNQVVETVDRNSDNNKLEGRISNGRATNHVVSFGGMTARVGHEAVVGKKVLLDKTKEEGVTQEDIEMSIMQLKVDPQHDIMIKQLPRTVGNKPQGLKAVQLDLRLVKETELMSWKNPYPPGSAQYITMDPNGQRIDVRSLNNPPIENRVSTPHRFSGKRGTTADLLSTLSGLVKKTGPEREL